MIKARRVKGIHAVALRVAMLVLLPLYGCADKGSAQSTADRVETKFNEDFRMAYFHDGRTTNPKPSANIVSAGDQFGMSCVPIIGNSDSQAIEIELGGNVPQASSLIVVNPLGMIGVASSPTPDGDIVGSAIRPEALRSGAILKFRAIEVFNKRDETGYPYPIFSINGDYRLLLVDKIVDVPIKSDRTREMKPVPHVVAGCVIKWTGDK